jgi:hypothetical protein
LAVVQEDDAAELTKKAAAEAERAVAEHNADVKRKSSSERKPTADSGAVEADEKPSKAKAGGAEEALATWEKTPKSKRGSKVGGDAPATPPVVTSGKSQLVDNADGTKWQLDLPAGGHKSDMKLTWLGDSLVFRYKKGDTQNEHTVALPQSFSESAVSAKLSAGGDTLHIELDKNDGAISGVADGDVTSFETTPDAACDADSIVVDLSQTRSEVCVGLRPSRSTESVVVVFSNGALEVRATRIEQRVEADKSVSKVKKTVLETIKIPFKPQSITVVPDSTSARVVTLTKPQKTTALVTPKDISIH